MEGKMFFQGMGMAIISMYTLYKYSAKQETAGN
jgi:hypothetical protein